MAKKKSIAMPFAKVQDGGGKLAGEMGVKMKSSNYFSFSSRRNAGHIQKLFDKTQSKKKKIIIVLFVTIFMLASLGLVYYYFDVMQKRCFASMKIHMLSSRFQQIYLHITSLPFQVLITNDLLTSWKVILRGPTNSSSWIRKVTKFLCLTFIKGTSAGSSYKLRTPEDLTFGIETSGNPLDLSIDRFSLYSKEDLNNKMTRYWNVDENHDNASYPDTGNDFIAENLAQSEIYFNQVSTMNASLWTEIYSGFFHNKQVPLASILGSGSYRATTAKNNFIASCDYAIAEILAFYNAFPISENSRISVTTKDGVLLCTTGDESPIDMFNGIVVSKDLSQLQDKIWSSVSAQTNILAYQNVTINAKFDGKMHEFFIIKLRYPPIRECNWTFNAAFCVDEFITQNSSTSVIYFSGTYLWYSIAFIGMMIICLIIYYIVSATLESKKTHILKVETENCLHIVRGGIHRAVKELHSIIQSHSDNPQLVSSIYAIISDLTNPTKLNLFDSAEIFQTISNPKVLNKCKSMFDPQKNDFPVIKVSPKKKNRAVSYSQTDQCAINAVDKKLLNLRLLQCKQEMTMNECVKIAQMFVEHDSTEMVLPIFAQIVFKINPDDLVLVKDSLAFALILFTKCDQIYSLPFQSATNLVFSIAVWYASFGNNRNSRKLIHERYFQNDYLSIESLLYSVEDNTIELIGREHSDSLLYGIFHIAKMSPLRKIYKVISKLLLYLIPIKESSVFSEKLKTEFIRLIYILSMCSYLINTPESTMLSQKRINTDYDRNIHQISETTNCMMQEIIAPSLNIIRNLLGAPIVAALIDMKSNSRHAI